MTKDSDFFENEIFLPRPKIANVAKWSHGGKPAICSWGSGP